MESISTYHKKINLPNPVDGFSYNDALAGEQLKVLVKAFVNSDQADFYEYMDSISNYFLDKYFIVHHICSFLILQHQDLSADIYVNNIPISIRVQSKRDFKKGEVVSVRDISDIQELKFEGIEIQRTDRIMFCIKVGWKFGLYFDFTKNIDEGTLAKELGRNFRYLLFNNEYAIIANKPLFNRLIGDGWFPFIQLLGSGDYKNLSLAYKYVDKEEKKFNAYLRGVLDSLDGTKIQSFTNYWWRIGIFKDKKKLLESGIRAYLQNTEDGFILCLKTLYSEIEGIIRISYYNENKKNPSFSELKQYIHQKAKSRFSDRSSLGFPDIFYQYLDRNIFASFDLSSGDIKLSRHSASHGVALPKEYDQVRALQSILTLDQIRFYLTQ